MPRNVRNFWIELTVDGKSTRIETGPQAKDGGFNLVLLMRDSGDVSRAAVMDGRVLSDGRIQLTFEPASDAKAVIDDGRVIIRKSR